MHGYHTSGPGHSVFQKPTVELYWSEYIARIFRLKFQGIQGSISSVVDPDSCKYIQRSSHVCTHVYNRSQDHCRFCRCSSWRCCFPVLSIRTRTTKRLDRSYVHSRYECNRTSTCCSRRDVDVKDINHSSTNKTSIWGIVVVRV